MKFRAPAGRGSIRIALTSGHTAIIGPDWRELDEIFHQEALGKGAECDKTRVAAKKVVPQAGPGAKNQKSDEDRYREGIAKLIERNGAGDLNKDGQPNIAALGKVMGITANKEEALRVFHLMQDERKDAVRDALIAIVDRDDEDDFTAEGLPKVEAVDKLAGGSATRAEIDAIWDDLKQQAQGDAQD